MRKLGSLFFLLVLLSLACSLVGQATPEPTPTLALQEDPDSRPLDSAAGESEKRCGDGICDGPENAVNCSEDCGADEDPLTGVGESGSEYFVTNPTSGNELYVNITTPTSGQEPYPTLVLVSGGIGDSSDFLRKGMPQRLADAGFVVVVFDPDGRNNSQGEEDYDGHIHQDGLGAVIEFAATRPEIDPENIGLATFSYGIQMGSGALARHPDLPILFLMDWEGPVDRYDTTVECSNSTRIDFAPCEDEAFWVEREALKFISDVQVPYLRLQSEIDHVQADNSHAVNVINAAVEGDPPWVRLNDYLVNETYNPNNPPQMLAEALDKNLEALVEKYAKEMFELHGK